MREQVFFYGAQRTHGFLSNFYPAPIWIDDLRFNCSEQYYMYKKALTFGDYETACKIKEASSAGKQKRLGRQVATFHDNIWNRVSRDFMFRACMAKFTQNATLRDAMLRFPVDTQFIEASPTDLIWGVGLDIDTAIITPEKEWPGTNWLGQILSEVRTILT